MSPGEQPPVEDEPGPDAFGDADLHNGAPPPPRPEPGLAQRRQVGVVHHRAGHSSRDPSAGRGSSDSHGDRGGISLPLSFGICDGAVYMRGAPRRGPRSTVAGPAAGAVAANRRDQRRPVLQHLDQQDWRQQGGALVPGGRPAAGARHGGLAGFGQLAAGEQCGYHASDDRARKAGQLLQFQPGQTRRVSEARQDQPLE